MPVPVVIDNSGANTTAGRVTRQNFPLASDIVLVTSANQANIVGGVLPMTIEEYAKNAAAFYFDFLQSPNPMTGGTTTTTIDADGTFVNSSGVLTQKTANVWPLDYNPSTLQTLGRPVFEARTNLLLNSLLNGTSLSTQDVTVSAVPYTLSFYGTGTVTLSGASTAGPLVGTGAYPNRVTLTFTPSAGTLTLTVSGTVQYAQLEAGSFATPFIPTAGASVARAADSCLIALPSGFSATEGTFVVEFTPSTAVTGNKYVMAASNGTNGELYGIVQVNGNFIVIDNSVLQVNINNAASIAANSIAKICATYRVNDFSVSTNGSAAATDTSGTLPTVTTLNLGSDGAGTQILNGWLRKLYYFNTKFDDRNATRAST